MPCSLFHSSVLHKGVTSASLEGNTLGSNFADSLRTTYGSFVLQDSFFQVSPKCPLTQVKRQDSLLVKFSFTGVNSPRTQHTVKSLGAKTASPQQPDAQFHFQMMPIYPISVRVSVSLFFTDLLRRCLIQIYMDKPTLVFCLQCGEPEQRPQEL